MRDPPRLPRAIRIPGEPIELVLVREEGGGAHDAACAWPLWTRLDPPLIVPSVRGPEQTTPRDPAFNPATIERCVWLGGMLLVIAGALDCSPYEAPCRLSVHRTDVAAGLGGRLLPRQEGGFSLVRCLDGSEPRSRADVVVLGPGGELVERWQIPLPVDLWTPGDGSLAVLTSSSCTWTEDGLVVLTVASERSTPEAEEDDVQVLVWRSMAADGTVRSQRLIEPSRCTGCVLRWVSAPLGRGLALLVTETPTGEAAVASQHLWLLDAEGEVVSERIAESLPGAGASASLGLLVPSNRGDGVTITESLGVGSPTRAWQLDAELAPLAGPVPWLGSTTPAIDWGPSVTTAWRSPSVSRSLFYAELARSGVLQREPERLTTADATLAARREGARTAVSFSADGRLYLAVTDDATGKLGGDVDLDIAVPAVGSLGSIGGSTNVLITALAEGFGALLVLPDGGAPLEGLGGDPSVGSLGAPGTSADWVEVSCDP